LGVRFPACYRESVKAGNALRTTERISFGASPAPSTRAIRRIIHPTDLSSTSQSALAWAIELAERNQVELLLIHVLTPPTPIYEIESPLRPQVEAAMSALATEARQKRVSVKRLFLKGTLPVDKQIVQAARTLRADLIVMGTHGRTGFSRLFAGSVASRVVGRAHCPVLVVRADP